MDSREPKLPVDHLLFVDEEDVSRESREEWVRNHQKRLQDALNMAMKNTEKEALRRKARSDKTANAMALQVGARVFLRNHSIRGRNKIQDAWEETPYKVIDRPEPEGNTYVIEALNGTDTVKVVHRNNLLDSKELVQDEAGTTEDEEDNPNEEKEEQSHKDRPDLEEELEVGYMERPMDAEVEPEEMEVVNQPELQRGRDDIETAPDIIVEPPRRSSRRTAGQHSNPHNLPQSTVQEMSSNPLSQPLPPIDPEVLAHLAKTQMLLAQALMANK